MRLLLLANDVASSVTPRTRVVIAKALAADHKVEVVKTSHRGDATALARNAAADGFEVVVVLGGDGTLNEAANGLAGTDVALGVLPGGSTNVYARTLGIADDPVEATAELVASLNEPEPTWRRRIGLGEVNGRAFVFHTGVGFDADVVARVERRSTIKRWAGHPLFVLSALSSWAAYDRTHRFRIAIEGSAPIDSPFAILMNSNPYTYLGARPIHLAPDTDFDAGLAVIAFRKLQLASTILATGQSLLRPGGPVLGHTLTRHEPVRELRIESNRPIPYQVDGDYLGEETKFVVRHHPSALDVITPRR